MLADPTFRPLYNPRAVCAFEQTNRTLHVYGSIGTGTMETIVRGIWARHVAEPEARFVMVFPNNEFVQEGQTFVSQHLLGQHSLNGIAIAGPPLDPEALAASPLHLLICSYETLVRLDYVSYFSRPSSVHFIFFDAELLCTHTRHIQESFIEDLSETDMADETETKQQKKRNIIRLSSTRRRLYARKRVAHSNAAPVVEAPVPQNYYADFMANLVKLKSNSFSLSLSLSLFLALTHSISNHTHTLFL